MFFKSTLSRMIAVLSVLLISFLISCHNQQEKKDDKKTTDSTGIKVAKETAPESLQPDKYLNDLARFSAGIPIDSTSKLYKLSKTAEWQAYYNESAATWKRFDENKNKIREWSTKEGIVQLNVTNKTLFYPFGGPDFLFADILFPMADKYVLIGLEKPGQALLTDSLKKKDLKTLLSSFKTAINDVIWLSFFKTNDMKTELSSQVIDGTVPIIMIFLARSGKEIIQINTMKLNDDGTLVKCAPTKSKKKEGTQVVEIIFKDPQDKHIKTIQYFSTNLADFALKKNNAFNNYLTKLDSKLVTFVKSATYLMHKPYFSQIRNIILDKSSDILQDDSGISYSYFGKDKWDITLYGTYTRPIKLFNNFYQDNLFDDFKTNAKPMNLRIGYSYPSNLMLAKKK